MRIYAVDQIEFSVLNSWIVTEYAVESCIDSLTNNLIVFAFFSIVFILKPSSSHWGLVTELGLVATILDNNR